MKLKKWLFGTVLSFCLLMNTLAMPAASAGVLDEFAEKNFPTIVALQDEYKNKSAVLDGMEYFERWREYVDQGVAKLQEWGDKLKEKGMTLALDHFSEKSGPKEQVDKCKAALSVEGQMASGAVRIQYLVPIDTNKPTSLDNVHRVQGVGVSARLDLGFPG